MNFVFQVPTIMRWHVYIYTHISIIKSTCCFDYL